MITATSILGPVALVATGPALERHGVDPTLVVLVAIDTVLVLLFSAAGLRYRASVAQSGDAAGLLAEEPGLVVDGEDEPPRARVAAGVARGRD